MSEAPTFYEPQIPTTTEYSTVTAVRRVITALDAGDFYGAALLVERMRWNPRLRGVAETRFNGLVASTIDWQPARNNRDARKAAQAMAEDWPRIAGAPARKQIASWGTFLGFAIGQRVPVVSPVSGRLLPVVRPYWPGWVTWDHASVGLGGKPVREYSVTVEWTPDAKEVTDRVPSPALSTTPIDPAKKPWIISEPFGAHSWRDGLIHAAWRPWLGHEWAMRDQNRASEKHGIGALKYFYPPIQDGDEKGKEAVAKFGTALRNLGNEGRIPCRRGEGEDDGFDVEPLEFNGSGFQAISDTMNANAVALAILLLGHNLTAEIKGGSFAAASVGDYIRDDVKNADAAGEWAWLGPQVVEAWALWNFGDPGLAPVAVYKTDSVAVNQAAASTYQSLAQAIATLRNAGAGIDIDALLERFHLPLIVDGKSRVQSPGVESQPNAQPAPAIDATAQPAAMETQTEAMPAKIEITVTPTDEATAFTLDEFRASKGAAPIGGEVGARYLAEHSAIVRAASAPEIATAAKAEAGTAPGEQSPAPVLPFGAPKSEPVAPEKNTTNEP